MVVWSLRCFDASWPQNRFFYLFPGASAGFRLEVPRRMPMASLSSRSGPLARFGLWLADAINHAFGNPREEGAHRPPLVGVQPYRDRPRRRSR